MPQIISTDKCARSGAAKADLLPHGAHRQHTRVNNRAEHSHQPTHVREKIMRRCTSSGHAQRLLAAHGIIRQHFCRGRHRYSAPHYHSLREERFTQWHTITDVEQTAHAMRFAVNSNAFQLVSLLWRYVAFLKELS